jgi:hypothetical protein
MPAHFLARATHLDAKAPAAAFTPATLGHRMFGQIEYDKFFAIL